MRETDKKIKNRLRVTLETPPAHLLFKDTIKEIILVQTAQRSIIIALE